MSTLITGSTGSRSTCRSSHERCPTGPLPVFRVAEAMAQQDRVDMLTAETQIQQQIRSSVEITT